MVPIDTKTQDDYYKALDVFFCQYNKGGFVIKTIYCDGEYCAMMNKVSDDLDSYELHKCQQPCSRNGMK